MKIAKEAEIEIDKSSNVYRPAAARGSLIFFLMCELYKLHTFYLYSLESYIFVIQRAVKSVQAKWKVILKIDDHAAEENNEENQEEKKEDVEEKEDEMNDNQRLHRVVKGLSKLDVFSNIIDILGASSEQNFWRKWLNEDAPEKSDLPKSMNHLTQFQKLLIIRALRPDRITSALTNYIIEMMTDKFIENVSFDPKATFSESNQFTPIFFVLFPGVDPTPIVESLGKNYNKINNNA